MPDLSLDTVTRLARIAFLAPDDFMEPDCRALFVALREFAAPDVIFDRDLFRATLDPELLALHDRLIGQGIPDLDEPELAREIENTAHRLRLQRDKAELSQLEVLLRDKDEEQSADTANRLLERVSFLRRRLMDSQKALGSRAILGRI